MNKIVLIYSVINSMVVTTLFLTMSIIYILVLVTRKLITFFSKIICNSYCSIVGYISVRTSNG